MKHEELIQLISLGESETLEFKASFNRSVIETIVAFSNTNGGKVIIGVNDHQKIIGATVTEESVQKWVNEIKQNTEPSIIPELELVDVHGKTIIKIFSKRIPHQACFF